jgi:lysyl-tRNA synthetase class 2
MNPPREISPLAKASKTDPEEAERFELVIAGIEVANAFTELTDPAEQRKMFEEQAEQKEKGDEESHPIDLDYIEALEYGLPPTGGQGIGIDRLAMIFANTKSIREVILFPLLRPK